MGVDLCPPIKRKPTQEKGELESKIKRKGAKGVKTSEYDPSTSEGFYFAITWLWVIEPSQQFAWDRV